MQGRGNSRGRGIAGGRQGQASQGSSGVQGAHNVAQAAAFLLLGPTPLRGMLWVRAQHEEEQDGRDSAGAGGW